MLTVNNLWNLMDVNNAAVRGCSAFQDSVDAWKFKNDAMFRDANAGMNVFKSKPCLCLGVGNILRKLVMEILRCDVFAHYAPQIFQPRRYWCWMNSSASAQLVAFSFSKSHSSFLPTRKATLPSSAVSVSGPE